MQGKEAASIKPYLIKLCCTVFARSGSDTMPAEFVPACPAGKLAG
jgi:hypothetical protein